MAQTISGAVASTHPVQFELDALLKVARWRVIGNPIMAIPHFIYLALLGIVLGIFTLIAFFAILFTGAYPRGMFNFSTGGGPIPVAGRVVRSVHAGAVPELLAAFRREGSRQRPRDVLDSLPTEAQPGASIRKVMINPNY
jgi:hypothetical protein